MEPKKVRAHDLRIGNLVFVYDKTIMVTAQMLYEGGISEYVNGIPLTEEWLVKFGFIRSDGDLFEINIIKNDKCISELWTRIEPVVFITIGTFQRDTEEQTDLTIDYVKNVHQLQNLFFALTGEELTLKT